MSNCIYTYKGKTFTSKEKLLAYLNRGISDTSYKETKEWLYLTELVGEEQATKIYIANNYNLPSKEDMEKLAKQFLNFSFIDNRDYWGTTMMNYTIAMGYQNATATGTQAIQLNEEYQKELWKRYNDTSYEIAEARRVKNYNEVKRLRYKMAEILERISNVQKNNTVESLLKEFDRDYLEISYLPSTDKVTFREITEIRNIVNFWDNVYDVLVRKMVDNPLRYREAFREIETKIEPIKENIEARLEILIEEFVKTKSKDPNFDLNKYIASVKDTNILVSETLSLSEQNFILLQALHKEYKEEAINAQRKATKVVRELDEVTKPAIETLKSLGFGSFRDVFEQKWGDTNTGQLISPYSYEYNRTKMDLFHNAVNTKRKMAWKKYKDWRKENEILLDVRILFPNQDIYYQSNPPTAADREAYIQSLRTQLQGEDVDTIISEAEKLVNDFAAELNEYNEFLDIDLGNDEEAKGKARHEYLVARSPYYYAEMIMEDKKFMDGEKHMFNEGYMYSKTVPKKFKEVQIGNTTNLVETGFYDKRFEVIKENESLYNFWTTFMKIKQDMNTILPATISRKMNHNEIPYARKTVNEVFKEDGTKKAGAAVWLNVQEAFTINGDKDLDYVSTDVAGQEINKLKMRMVRDDSYFYDRVDKLVKLGYDRTRAQKEILAEMSAEQSFDLPVLLKKYAELALMYEAKRKVEPILIATENVLNSKQESVFKDTGEAVDVKRKEDSFTRYKEVLKAFKMNFYDKSTQHYGRIPDWKIKDKKVLEENEDRKRKIEAIKEDLARNIAKQQDIIEKSRYQSAITRAEQKIAVLESEAQIEIDKLEKEIETSGSAVVATKFLEVGLKYFHVKALGWNLPSFVSNIGFGYINNLTEASAGQFYDFNSYMKAVGMGMASIGNNMTFNQYKKFKGSLPGADTAHKIRALMDNFEILKSAKDELAVSDFNKGFNDATRWLLPYNLTERAEYINQSNVLIAMMLHKKYNVNGQEVSMYDMFDVDGEVKSEYKDIITEEEWVNFKIAVDQVIIRLHGNYDKFSPFKLQSTIFGKTIMMFRRWMFSGFNTRYEGERKDLMLDEMVKGRYITLWHYFSKDNKTKNQRIDKWSKMGLLGKFGVLFTDLAGAYLTRFANIGRAVSGNQTVKTFQHMNEIDAQNMRRVLTEIQWMIGLMMFITAMAAAIDDDKEEEDEEVVTKGPKSIFTKRSMLYFIHNTSARMITDIEFYINPISFGAIVKDPVPFQRIFDDGGALYTALIKYMGGEEYYETGMYSGHHRLSIRAANMLPLFSTYPRLYSFTHKEVRRTEAADLLLGNAYKMLFGENADEEEEADNEGEGDNGYEFFKEKE